MGYGGRPETATFKFYVNFAGGLMRRPEYRDERCRLVGQVGNLRRVGNPPAAACQWPLSAGCQPARRIPSCPPKPAGGDCVPRASLSNETFGFSPRLRVSAVILLTSLSALLLGCGAKGQT